VIKSALYRDPQMLDSKQHRNKRLKLPDDMLITKNMHAVFVAGAEVPQAALEYPIIFVRPGEKTSDGKDAVSPVALLGLIANENLRLDEQGRWNARYVPAYIRRYPFLSAQVSAQGGPSVFVDTAWDGFSDTEGDRLFDDEGKPTERLTTAIEFLSSFDREQVRTRMFCERLVQLDILREMTADATLPNGANVKVEGILSVDEEKLAKLPDSVVLELHRSGMLMLLHAHLISLANIRYLVEFKAQRLAAQAPPAADKTATA